MEDTMSSVILVLCSAAIFAGGMLAGVASEKKKIFSTTTGLAVAIVSLAIMASYFL